MVEKRTRGEKIFDVFNVLVMLFLIILTIYPLYYVFVCSISDSNLLMESHGFKLLPAGFSLDSYKAVFSNPNILTGFKTTLFVLVVGTSLNVVFTSIGAFLLTRKQFAMRKFMSVVIMITMFFGGGMIPTYLVVYKWLDLGNSIWALILPGLISTYNLTIMRTSFASLPDSLEEAAKIDGANDIVILFKIMIPLSLPIIAVMVLFYGVAHWNSWFQAMLYIRERDMYPLQLILREILLINDASGMGDTGAGNQFFLGESIKYASIIVATVPILFAYPFIQKYFVKGIMSGAVKG